MSNVASVLNAKRHKKTLSPLDLKKEEDEEDINDNEKEFLEEAEYEENKNTEDSLD